MQQNILNPGRRRDMTIQNYFSRIYAYMGGGLLLSAIMAWLTVRPPMIHWFYKIQDGVIASYSIWGWIAIFAPLLVVFLIGHAANKLNVAMAQFWFWVFSALMGVSLSNILLAFNMNAVSQAFLCTAAMFFGLSLFGFKTERDLTSIGRFALIGLIGVVIVSVVNIFIGSGKVNFVLNILSVVIFTALTIYDTNKLKAVYQETDSEDVMKAKAIHGALALYLDFINLFRLMLYFLNSRR